MYYIIKKFEISASHSLKLSYQSKCEQLHGHNWIIEVHARSEKLNRDGMVIDFGHVKEKIQSQLDHRKLNDIFPDMNTTAENLAKWICDQIPECYKVMIQESESNVAWYEKDQ